jgi:hypothetical protein
MEYLIALAVIGGLAWWYLAHNAKARKVAQAAAEQVKEAAKK